jgi:U3 small nucleolar RNA-associated protein MPP10
LFKKICWNLDRLANFHFTPKPDLEVKKLDTSAPSIKMEEALPVATSEATTLAPEEIYAKKRQELKGETERTQEDKKRDRRRVKEVKKRKNQEREERDRVKRRLNPELAPSKEKAEKELLKNKERVSICFFVFQH